MADKNKKNKEEEKKSKNFVPLLLIINLIVIIGIGAFVGFMFSDLSIPNQEKVSGKGKADYPGHFVPLEHFVVNLDSGEFLRYVRVTLALEVQRATEEEDLKKFNPIIRNSIIEYLSDRRVEELQGSKNLQNTRREMLGLINNVVGPVDIKNIHVIDILIQ